MKGREMKNKRSLLFMLCGMLLIPQFLADTQVLAAKKEVGNGAVVVRDKAAENEEPKKSEKSGGKSKEASGEKSDKESKDNPEELTSSIKQDKSEVDKAENKEKKKEKNKKNKKKKNKKKSKGRNKKNSLKKNKKKKAKKDSKKGSKNNAKKGKKGKKNSNNKKSKKGNKNKKKDNKKVNEEKNLDLKEEEVGKIPETDEYKPVDNTDFSNAGIVNDNSQTGSHREVRKKTEDAIREYTIFCEYTDGVGKLRFKSGNTITLPESGYVGFVANGENTGKEDKITWEGKDLESIKKGIKGNYVLTCITGENVVIGGKDYGKLKFLVYIIVE